MSTTHTTTTRTALADEIKTLVNANSDACLIIGTSSLALPSTGVLAIIPLSAFGAASSGVTTSASSGASATAIAPGTAAIGIIANDSSSPASTAEIFRGAVATSGSEITINTTTIASGDLVTLTSDVTWTAPT